MAAAAAQGDPEASVGAKEMAAAVAEAHEVIAAVVEAEDMSAAAIETRYPSIVVIGSGFIEMPGTQPCVPRREYCSRSSLVYL